MRPVPALLSLALLALPMPLLAQDGAGGGAPVDDRPPQDRPAAATLVAEPLALVFAGCDADRDGRTSKAELDECLKQSFDAVAKGAGDIGYIGYGDWAAKWLGNATALPGPFEIDSNNDNRITLSELQARFAAIFDRIDADHDGFVTRAELLTIRGGGGPGQGGFGGKRGKRR